MNFLNELMFAQIPLFALLCNVFLLFTLLSAKKDGSIKAFMGLLIAFILWAGGAFLMRIQMYPGVNLWWDVSLTGIFLVPYMYFLLFSSYTEQKGNFLKIVFGLLTLLMVVLNIFNVFMSDPEVTMADGHADSVYAVKWPAVLPVILTLVIFVFIWCMVSRTLKAEDMPVAYLMPLFVGIAVMLAGIGINTVFTSIPTDTLGCAVNAACIYYAFYMKRFYALSQITSKGSMYVVSILITGLAVSAVYQSVERFVANNLANTGINATLLITITCSAMAILLFMGLNKLHDGLFVREQLRRDDRVHEFTTAVNSTLKTSEILQRFADLVKEEIAPDHMYICMFDEVQKKYTSDINILSLEQPLSMEGDHPMVQRLQRTGSGLLYTDFQKTTVYKSMWEKEKQMLAAANASYILPFTGDERVLGFVVLADKQSRKNYTYTEINFLESVASVASIALKNAMLYQVLEKEALLDPLTGLLNRRTLNKRIEEQFAAKATPLTLVLLNLDDFSLYNELYGSEEGDKMLKQFGGLLEQGFGDAAIISRYGGKEFAVLLPYCDALTAMERTKIVQKLLADHISNSRERIKKFLTFSAGICSYPTVAANGNQLISYANMAVFQLKQNGKNNIKIYDRQAAPHAEESLHGSSGIQELTSTIYALTAAIDAKDHYTFNHSQCVSKYASALAEHAGLEQDLVDIIRQAGLLHDIGKIGIPDVILTKSGRLDPEEFSIMRQHVERSIEMIRHLPSLDYVIPAVLGHHERFDGKGYPRGISGEDIPISARCLSIADSFDAMVSKRSYKNKMPVEDALMEIEKNLGTQFDPQLGRLFINLIKDGTIEVINY